MDRPLTSTERSRRFRQTEKAREYDRRYAAEYAQRHPGYTKANNARRVYVGEIYVGMAPTAEQASTLNQQAREEFHGR